MADSKGKSTRAPGFLAWFLRQSPAIRWAVVGCAIALVSLGLDLVVALNPNIGDPDRIGEIKGFCGEVPLESGDQLCLDNRLLVEQLGCKIAEPSPFIDCGFELLNVLKRPQSICIDATQTQLTYPKNVIDDDVAIFPAEISLNAGRSDLINARFRKGQGEFPASLKLQFCDGSSIVRNLKILS
jgi:hypothetical protein